MTDTTLNLTVQPDGTRTPRVDLPFRHATHRDPLRPARGILRGTVIGACLWLALLCGWVVLGRLWERM